MHKKSARYRPARFHRVFTIKIPAVTKERIELLNEANSNLITAVRTMIISIVDDHFCDLDKTAERVKV